MVTDDEEATTKVLKEMGRDFESNELLLTTLSNEPGALAKMATKLQRFVEALNKELGHTRGSCPFDRYICVNSGSESVCQPQVNAINRRIANTIVQISTILYFGGVISGSPARIRTWVSRSRVSNDGPLHYGASLFSFNLGT